jgi:hypothetical protein
MTFNPYDASNTPEKIRAEAKKWANSKRRDDEMTERSFDLELAKTKLRDYVGHPEISREEHKAALSEIERLNEQEKVRADFLLATIGNRSLEHFIVRWKEVNDELASLRELVGELVRGGERLMPFIHENGMEGETEYEKAVLAFEVSLSRAKECVK